MDGGRGDPPIRSLTSLLTSSLSFDRGSGDLARPGVAPRVSSCEGARPQVTGTKQMHALVLLTSLFSFSFFFCSRDFRSSSNFLRFFSNSAFLSAMACDLLQQLNSSPLQSLALLSS